MLNEVKNTPVSAKDCAEKAQENAQKLHEDAHTIQMRPRELWFGWLIFFLAGFSLGGLITAAMLANH